MHGLVRPRSAVLALAIPVTALALLIPASASAADPEAGLTIARQWCAECHLVEERGSSPDAAPPFSVIANDPAYTEARLRGWLADPHPPMPKLELSRQQIDAIVAYLKSLRTP